jgi:hypothetical protein
VDEDQGIYIVTDTQEILAILGGYDEGDDEEMDS